MKIKLIYNPEAGNKNFKHSLDACFRIFQKAGYDVHVFRTISAADIVAHISETDGGYSAFAVAGGDGTVNLVLNAVLARGLDIPIGIIPAGTANDFAKYLKLPREPHKAAEIIAGGKTARFDAGRVNGTKYFLNVCAAGLMANISHEVDVNLKNTFGKLAYYAKGLEQLPNFAPLPMRITHGGEKIESELFFFIVLNGTGTGGFENLSPGARADDGLFDFIGFKAMSLVNLGALFVKVLMGDYLDDPNVIFFRDDKIIVENLSDGVLLADIDGEKGPALPVTIENIPRAVSVFIK